MLKENWSMPELPSGYEKALIHIGMSGNITLDFTKTIKPIFRKEKTYVYSIENNDSDIQWEWPWRKGYKATIEDWEAIGFEVYHSFDSCFGEPPKEYMFKHWINKD